MKFIKLTKVEFLYNPFDDNSDICELKEKIMLNVENVVYIEYDFSHSAVCTRVVLKDGNDITVRESKKEIMKMIEA